MARPRSSPGDWRRPRPTDIAPAPRWRRYLRFPPAAGSTAAGLRRPATDECRDWTDWPWRLLARHVPRRPAASRQRPRPPADRPPQWTNALCVPTRRRSSLTVHELTFLPERA